MFNFFGQSNGAQNEDPPKTPKSGVASMIENMLGIDIDELTGQMTKLASVIGPTLIMYEQRLTAIEQSLLRIETKLGTLPMTEAEHAQELEHVE